MIEVLISSSVLILAVCLARLVFRRRVSLRIQYGLWGLVALRLVIPMFYPLQELTKAFQSRFSVMNAANAVHSQMIKGTGLELLADNVASGRVYTFEGTGQPLSLVHKAAGIDWQLWIMAVWTIGAVFLAIWMAVVNIRFHKMLVSRRRRFYENVPGFVTKRVYVVEGITSPCYFGLGADEGIYIPSWIADDKEMLRHALAHETCHAVHGDRFWGILRCGLLCYYWVDPLVWLAAALSRQDCELACDEAAVKLLGEEERYAYGRTLVSMIAAGSGRKSLFCAATTMTDGRHTIRERIGILAKHPRTTSVMAIVVTGTVAVMAACTFTGGVNQDGGTGADEYAASLTAELEGTGQSGGASGKGGGSESESAADETVLVGQGDMLALVKAEQWGNYYRLTMERRDVKSGRVLPVSYRNDGMVYVTSYSDSEGTIRSGDGQPDQGFGYTQTDGESFVIDVWNVEQAGSYRISIIQDDRSVDYLFATHNRELLEQYASSQVMEGSEGRTAKLVSVEVYPDMYCMKFLGLSGGDAQQLALELDGKANEEATHRPGYIKRSGNVTDVLFFFDEDVFPERSAQAVAVMTDGTSPVVVNQLDTGQLSPSVYDVARAFCEAYMSGDLKTAAMYSSFSDDELSDAIPINPSENTRLTVRWDPEDKEVYADGVYQFRAQGEDSYTYLNLELKYAYGQWRVTWKGFEK